MTPYIQILGAEWLIPTHNHTSAPTPFTGVNSIPSCSKHSTAKQAFELVGSTTVHSFVWLRYMFGWCVYTALLQQSKYFFFSWALGQPTLLGPRGAPNMIKLPSHVNAPTRKCINIHPSTLSPPFAFLTPSRYLPLSLSLFPFSLFERVFFSLGIEEIAADTVKGKEKGFKKKKKQDSLAGSRHKSRPFHRCGAKGAEADRQQSNLHDMTWHVVVTQVVYGWLASPTWRSSPSRI